MNYKSIVKEIDEIHKKRRKLNLQEGILFEKHSQINSENPSEKWVERMGCYYTMSFMEEVWRNSWK